MIFAGVTSVLAKAGLRGISGELGLVMRTAFVLVLVLALALPCAAVAGVLVIAHG